MSVQDDLVKQILASSNTSKWSGAGHGSAEANARDMAKILAGIGITDIKQFGKVSTYEQATAQKGYNGQVAQQDEDGNYFIVVNSGFDNEGNPVSSRQNVDPKDLQTIYGSYQNISSNPDEGSAFVPADPSTVKMENGVPFVKTGENFGNKATGQAVPNTYTSRQTGNFFGGTYEGKGNTGYGVQFDAQGNPIFYTQGATSNDLAILMKDLGPIGQIGLALATGGLSIPQQIAANMALQVLSGQDIGSAIKNAAISMAVANIPGTDFMKDGAKYIEKMGLDPTITKTLTNSFQNAVTSGATAALRGQDISDAMLRGAATGGVNGAVNALLNSADMTELTKDLSATQKRLVANAVTGVISGKPLDQILINTAIAAASAEAKDQAKYKPLSDEDYKDLNPDQRAKYDEGGTKGLREYQRAQILAEDKERAAQAAQENELRITAARDAEAARLAEQERLAREAQQTATTTRSISPRTPVPPENTVSITAPKAVPECPPGFVYDQDLKMCTPKESTATLPTDPPKPPVSPVPPEIKITAPRAVPECPPGFVYDQDLKMCVPKEGIATLPTDPPNIGTVKITAKKDPCPPGTVYDEVLDACVPIVDDKGTVTIVGKKDPCPPGTVYDEVLDACVPITTTPPAPTPPTPTPPTPPVTKPTTTTPTTTKPTVTTPKVPASFVPSSGGAAMSTETTDPIYAGKMGDFNLFATLEELLANESGEKASTKPSVKTKMATGGHLDDLLAEQMTVDDLLNLLR